MRAIVFDDTPELAERAHEVLGSFGYQVTRARTIDELTAAIDRSSPSDLLLARLTGDGATWKVAQVVRELAFAGRLVALVDHLAHPGTAHLSQLLRTRCVLRPPTRVALEALLKQSAHPSSGGDGVPTPPSPMFYGMVGQSRQILDIFNRIDKVAASDANVCIYGESGTGKELVSRALHYAGPRRNQPFVTLDCTAMPEGLMESHLFGHVRGAFTGAVDQREGVFSLANLGTLFIDELSDLSLPLQAKLLRVIQTREFSKVGASKPIQTNIRLITAMNQDPKRAVEQGSFREDLYYRVAVVMLRMPPLRERREDISLLVDHFLRRFAAAYHKPVMAVSPRALDRITNLPWPGNVRQLENFIQRAFVLVEGDVLTERDLFPDGEPLDSPRALPGSEWAPPPRAGAARPVAPGEMAVGLPDPRAREAGSRPLPAGDFEPGLPLREVERRHILRTLQSVHGNRTEAAKRLGISVRALQYKLKSYSKAEDPALPVPPPRGAAGGGPHLRVV